MKKKTIKNSNIKINVLPDKYYKVKKIERVFKIVYFIVFSIVIINILFYSYKAWLYPIRTNLYFDECSYLSMGKYFRTISPITIFKDHIIKNKKIPNLYNEFNCRLINWSIILSIPLKYTEDIIKLHKFRAILMTFGTLIFFLIGFKLSGILGGIIASALWIGTPLLNYWGHFFMTENPSYIFLVLGFLFLLLSSKFKFSSLLGGFLIGLSAFTRFTTSPLIIASPFIIIAVYFDPFKRKNFQIIGELAKSLSGFIFAALPYFIFTLWIFKNPLTPFLSANNAVNRFPVDDSFYYVRNLWIEGGNIIKIGSIIAIFAPLLLSISRVIKILIKDNNLFYKDIYQLKNNLYKRINLLMSKKTILKYLKIFFKSFIYYSIIIVSLVLTTSIYLISVTKIPHKLPRYLMGALIPVILITSIGFGAIEPLILNFFRFIGKNFLLNGIKRKNFKKISFIIIWLMLFIISLSTISLIGFYIWHKTMTRPFTVNYDIPKVVKKTLIKNNDKISLLRLQPENIAWKKSINERLANIKNNPKDTKFEYNMNYYGTFTPTILDYLNNKLKKDEVFYVDRLNQTPYTPAYLEVPCIYIDNLYNNSISRLINKGEIKYKGYLLVSNNIRNDIIIENNYKYVRSINKLAINKNNKFKYIKKIGNLLLYYYKGEPFPYKYGTKDRIKKLTAINNKKEINNTADPEKSINKNNKIIIILKKIFSPWEHLFNYNLKKEKKS